ncbi:MAG: DUF4405 domain-containing protein [Clostridiales Family XIII bacterium]|jgi:hypothetical protein|nr:DUF4405 domain-containing protein [Clostridiales Family XIII bacterium]
MKIDKNLAKIVFDLIMVILFALMYDTNITGMAIHEWGGLLVIALVTVHLIYNRSWIVSVSKRIFKRKSNKIQVLSYVINVLLAMCVCMIFVSGILISREIFPIMEKSSEIWLIVHIGAALLAMILIGVHIGLHRKFITGTLKKFVGKSKITPIAMPDVPTEIRVNDNTSKITSKTRHRFAICITIFICIIVIGFVGYVGVSIVPEFIHHATSSKGYTIDGDGEYNQKKTDNHKRAFSYY